MELDHYKSAWKNEHESASIPQISLRKQKEIHHPLDRIRTNMRLEFWSTVVLLIFIFSMIWSVGQDFSFKFYLTMIVGSMVLVTSFFYYQFFRLYRELSRSDYNTVDALKDLLSQFRLNEQYYVSFYVSFVPFLICEMILIAEFTPYIHLYSHTYFVVVFLAVVLLGLGVMYVLGRWWFYLFYGKYIRKIRFLYHELTHPTEENL